MDALERARYVFDKEIDALQKTKDTLGEEFLSALDLIMNCEGKLIITGIGKPGHVAKKLAATFSSLGTPAFHLHPAEALHGDLGMVTNKDIVLVISYSGESDEIIKILPSIKMTDAIIIAVTGEKESTLVKYGDIAILLPKFEEACHLRLAPTSSTTVAMVIGDALAVVASEKSGFLKEDFAKFHPAGALGKRLCLHVKELMVKGEKIPSVYQETSLYEAIIELGQKGQGMVVVINQNRKIIGIITDGDLRRMMQRKVDIYNVKVIEVMNKKPVCTKPDEMAINVLSQLKKMKINGMVVANSQNDLVGIIRLQNIVDAGLI